MTPVRARVRSAVLVAAVVAVLLPVAGTASAAPAPAPATPAAPAVGQVVEGSLVQGWPEYRDRAAQLRHAEDGPLSWIRTAAGGTVRVPTADLSSIRGARPGARVRLTVGESLRDAATTEQGLAPARRVLAGSVVSPAPAQQTAPDVVAPAGVTDAVTVVMVQPGGVATDGRTLQEVVDAVNGSVSTFWSSQTAGQVQVGVTGQHDWLTTAATCADPEGLWNEVAADIGWTPGAGQHLLLYVPSTATGCAYGLGTVGASITSGGEAYVTDTATSLIAHELGHNFSLGHSSSLQCDGTADGADGGACQLLPYGDIYDVMGGSWDQVGSLSAPQAARLGVLPAARIADVTASGTGGTVTLTPVDRQAGTQAIRLTDAEGDVYWLENRQAEGQDGWLGDPVANEFGLETGVLLRAAGNGGDSAGDTSLLLDATPSAEAGWSGDDRVAVAVQGTPVVVANGEFTVTEASTGVVTVTVGGPVAAAWNRWGGAAGPLGQPTGPLRCGLRDGGCARPFQGGKIYWSPATGAHVVQAPPLTRYVQAGEQAGSLGYPTTDTTCQLRYQGCFTAFQNGSIYGQLGGGMFVVPADVRTAYAAAGWETGALLYPTGEQVCGLRGGGCVQVFGGGLVYTAPGVGTHYVSWAGGGFSVLYGQQQYENGRLGYPVTNPYCGLRGGGCFQQFQGGLMYWSPTTPSSVVLGAIGAKWSSTGWENGLLGYPRGSEQCGLLGGGCFQVFQNGSIYWSPATGAHWVRGAIRDEWGFVRWETGPLGYPVSDEICGLVGGGCLQFFQGGSIYWSPGTGAHAVSGALLAAWGAQGWERGALGYPVADPSPVPGGLGQRFQGGLLTYSAVTGRVTSSR